MRQTQIRFVHPSRAHRVRLGEQVTAFPVCLDETDDLEFLLGLRRGSILAVRGGSKIKSFEKQTPTFVNGFRIVSVLLIQLFQRLRFSLADEI